jgi:hypothetical protein
VREMGRKRIEFSGHCRHQVPVRDQGSTKHLIAVWCALRSTWLVQTEIRLLVGKASVAFLSHSGCILRWRLGNCDPTFSLSGYLHDT